MPYGRYFWLVLILAPVTMVFSGCNVDAIWLSRDTLDFGRDTNPMYFQVANENGALGTIDVSVLPSRSWIQVAPTLVPCKPPEAAGLVRQNVEVRIDRSRIPVTGRNEGTITLSAPGVRPVTIKVIAVQDSLTPSLQPLNIINPVTSFSAPYLVELAFSLRNQNDRAVTGEPAQFQVAAFENDIPMGTPQGLLLRRGAARQLWLELVMDYSVFMREIDNAIPEMERAATEVLLPSLNVDALVAVSGFYRDNLNSRLIVPYTVDRQHVSDEIHAIRGSHLTGFASGARVYDALISAIQRFDEVNAGDKDDKYIVLFCNGRDTSSTATAQQVINAAKARGVRIIAVGFGDSIDAGELITVALSSNGRFISASTLDDLQAAFERIVEDLSGQYVIRWASARRDGTVVRPSISLTLNGATAAYTSDRTFRANTLSGDPLRGELVLIQSETPGNTTVFLRANYVPYDISTFRFYVQSDYEFIVSRVGIADDGLLAGWNMSVQNDPDGGKVITLTGSQPIPFAAFGAMLRFEFADAVDTAFTEFTPDNSLYNDGQTFVIQ